MIPDPLRDALADVLACPSCGGALHETAEAGPAVGIERIACATCGRVWPVVDGVLDFLPTPVQEAPQEDEP